MSGSPTLTRADLLRWLDGRPDADPGFIDALGRFVAERVNRALWDMTSRSTAVTWAGELARASEDPLTVLTFVVVGGGGARIKITLPLAESKLLALAILEQEAWGAAFGAGETGP